MPERSRETLEEHLRKVAQCEMRIIGLQKRIKEGDLYPELMKDIRNALGMLIDLHVPKSQPCTAKTECVAQF